MNTIIKTVALVSIIALGACTYTSKEDCPAGQWKEAGSGHVSGAQLPGCNASPILP